MSSTGNVGPAAPNPEAAIAAALAGVGAADDPAALRLQNLQQEYQNLAAARKQNAKEMRSEKKKVKRLKDKAKNLSTTDLQDILIARAAEAAKGKGKGKGKAKGKAMPGAAAGAPPAAAAAGPV